MIRTIPYARILPPKVGGRRRLSPGSLLALGRNLGLALAAAIIAVLVLLVVGLSLVFVTLKQAPGSVAGSVSDGARDVPLESTIRVSPSGWAARLEGIELWETPLQDAPTSGSSQVPVHFNLIREGWLPGQTQAVIRPVEGSLHPDAAYRLVLRGSALAAALPWPRPAAYEQELHFTTPGSPKPVAAPSTVPLRWEAPLPIQWNMPIDEFFHQVTPRAKTRAWVEGSDRRTSYVVIEDPEEGITYDVTVTYARGTNGIGLQRPASYSVETPKRPLPADPDEPVLAEIGKPVTVKWNVPIERIDYALSPELKGTLQANPRDPWVTTFRVEGLEQGSSYDLTVLEAVSDRGAPLADPLTLTLETPPALEVVQFRPADGGWAPVTARPTIAFSERVRDRRAVEAAITAEPAVPGRFEWIDDRQVQFVPSRPYPYDTRIAFNIRSGPERARSVSGGYLEEDETFVFRTEPNKTIDVNVSSQRLTLIEGSQAVRSFLVSTGLPGVDTPIGDFRVGYKMRKAHFRGFNSATGNSYDLPDVNWVLAFSGDYTIHGAYWRQQFGRPGSNGCVSLTDADASVVYNWAPEGTLVRIHY
jgi:lipoprotein-anchoring transpeptidase ErfK/SrfK